MKKITSKKGSVSGTALVSSVASIVLSGVLIYGVHEYNEIEYKLNKAKEEVIVQEALIVDYKDTVEHLEIDIDKLTSEKKELLKDNDSLNQKLKTEREKNSQLQQKLKQAELQAEELRKKQ